VRCASEAKYNSFIIRLFNVRAATIITVMTQRD
jgi:hypothetical protein